MTDFGMANMVSFRLYVLDTILISPGLRPGQVHDQVLRSQLPRVSRSSAHPQGPLDLLKFVS